jgi:hypothetical protein
MQILKLIKSISFDYKKGGKLIFLPFFLFTISCASNSSKYGRVTLHNTTDKNSFVFSTSEEFNKINDTSPKDKKFPKMTQAEAKLLTNLLKEQKYCLNDSDSPSFIITSRQEKIYDMTFAHLIEQNYNARPIAPRMYFGQCKKE